MSIRFSPQAKALNVGIYEHYKGNRYRVVGVHSETLEEMVIYQSLDGEALTWVRPLKMFMDPVHINGKAVPRFRFLVQPK